MKPIPEKEKRFVKEGKLYCRLFLTKNDKATEDMDKAVRVEEDFFEAVKQKDGTFKEGKWLGSRNYSFL